MKNNLRLVNFQTSDFLSLPGLLYEPEKKTGEVVIYLHGNGSSSVFYNADKMNLFGGLMNKTGISFFPFNNRGAHWVKKLDKKTDGREERVLYGMAYELINECVIDIDAAVNFLKNLRYKTFYLAGASTGANKIVVYNYYKSLAKTQAKNKNRIAKYILISGGDDLGLYFNFYFKKNKSIFFSVLNRCRAMIKNGKGRKIVPSSLIPDTMISYQSLYDTINPDGDYNIFPFYDYLHGLNLGGKKLFKEFKTIDKQTLIIYGGLDEYCYDGVDKYVNILKKESSWPELFTFKIIKDADHGYSGKEKDLAEFITEWLS